MVATTATTATTAATAATATTATVTTLGVVAVVLLIALMITKELASASPHPRAQRLARMVDVGAVPLGFAVVAIVASRIVTILG